MRLLRIHVVAADTCGGLLDGFDVDLRSPFADRGSFDPLCLIGPNGAGKSQFLQLVAEVFQCAFHAVVPTEERTDGNPNLQFEIEYLIHTGDSTSHVRVARIAAEKRKAELVVQEMREGTWVDCNLNDELTKNLLPARVVGYTSGDNETLSLPFLISRGGYAKNVAEMALSPLANMTAVPDTRLMLIDYSTHLEVLVANLLLADPKHQQAVLSHARVDGLHSFRCVVQLAHSAVPKAPKRTGAVHGRKGVQLTVELEDYVDRLKCCATCFQYEEKTETYTFDFFVNAETVKAFASFWPTSLDLYSALHKLSMLNDLAIPRPTRDRFRRETNARRFASRLPEPQDEDKVFRFERVSFRSQASASNVDYVSLSDGEHQLAQLLGTFCMTAFPDVLFLLDEPESHFNPQWRVKFLSRLLDLPTAGGTRREVSDAAQQDCLLTTHAPFVPSDMPRDKVLIFGKDPTTKKIVVRTPEIETFGATFDAILSECFDVSPPISQESRTKIDELMLSKDADFIRDGMQQLGSSVEKVLLADRLRQLAKQGGA